MAVQLDQTLAVFVLANDASAKKFLKKVQQIDKADVRVQIVDAAIAHKAKFGRVKVHQTMDRGGIKGGVRGGTIGVVVGAIVAGPAGAAVAGAAGGVLAGLYNKFHDIGIDDKWMKQVGKQIDKGKSALFVQYEGDWSSSIGAIQDAVKSSNALLIESNLPAEKATALREIIEPAVEQLGGEEVVTEFVVETEVQPDDLTQLPGIGPKFAKALTAGGLGTYSALAAANEPQIRRTLHDADMTPPASIGSWPTEADFAARGDWAGLMKYIQKNQSKSKSKTSKKQAKTAKSEAAPKGKPDDLTKINGVGPRIESILNDGGVSTYDQLASTSSDELRRIMAGAGALPPASLSKWATQAKFAAKNDWQGLAAYNARR